MNIPAHELAGQRMMVDAEAVHITELSVVRVGELYSFRCVW